MPVRVHLPKQIANEMLERTTGGKDSGLKPEDANKRLLLEPPLLPKAMINNRIQYQRFSVQFMTPTSQFTPCESNGLVYKPHPRFLA